MLRSVLRALFFGRRRSGGSDKSPPTPMQAQHSQPTAGGSDAGEAKEVGGITVLIRSAGRGKQVLVNKHGKATRPLSGHEVAILEKRLRQSDKVRREFEKDPTSNFLKPRQPGR